MSVLTSSFCKLDSGIAPGSPAGGQREERNKMRWVEVVVMVVVVVDVVVMERDVDVTVKRW